MTSLLILPWAVRRVAWSRVGWWQRSRTTTYLRKLSEGKPPLRPAGR